MVWFSKDPVTYRKPLVSVSVSTRHGAAEFPSQHSWISSQVEEPCSASYQPGDTPVTPSVSTEYQPAQESASEGVSLINNPLPQETCTAPHPAEEQPLYQTHTLEAPGLVPSHTALEGVSESQSAEEGSIDSHTS